MGTIRENKIMNTENMPKWAEGWDWSGWTFTKSADGGHYASYNLSDSLELLIFPGQDEQFFLQIAEVLADPFDLKFKNLDRARIVARALIDNEAS